MRRDMTAALGDTPTGRNKFEGGNTRRVYAVFAKTREFDSVVTDPLVMGVVEDVLGSPHFNLSSPVGIQIGTDTFKPTLATTIIHRMVGQYANLSGNACGCRGVP